MAIPSVMRYCFCLTALTLLCVVLLPAQEKTIVQVKVFTAELKPFANLEVSFNGQEYFLTDKKGIAFAEVNGHELPPNVVTLKNSELEAASWNYSKGVLEIIVRKKSYQRIAIQVHYPDGDPVTNVPVILQGSISFSYTTNDRGEVEAILPLNEKITTKDHISVPGFQLLDWQQQHEQWKIVLERAPRHKLVVASEHTSFRDFDLKELDSIQSLTVFYAVFKNYQFSEFSPEVKRRIDRKFNQLMARLEDSLRVREKLFIGRISDSTFVSDDIKNLLAQAALENNTLEAQRKDFDQKISLINNKLSAGVGNLDPETREKLLADLKRLEGLLKENENKFYRNQTDYRTILSSMKEKFFDLKDIETKLSESEARLLEERRAFQKKLATVLSIASLFALLVVALIYMGSKLKKQKEKLVEANAEIKRMNEHLEDEVYERTRQLQETNHELDVFLYKASHDLRSPVCSIIGLCNLAMLTADSSSKDLLQRTVYTANHMDRLLRKLRIISEINEPTDYALINLRKVVEEKVAGFIDIIAQYHIDIVWDCDESVRFYSYPCLVETILYNLLENALFFSSLKQEENRRVVVKATLEPDHLELMVYDNGVGMNATIREHVYEMFFKGHEESKGNGLGLYIVNKSVQALRGHIELQTREGQFTRFMVFLPVKTDTSREKILLPDEPVMVGSH